MPVVVFSRRPESELAPTLVKRAACVLPIPFDLLAFRQELTKNLIHPTSSVGRKKKESPTQTRQILTDPDNLSVSVGGGEPIHLSLTEFKLLQLLLDHRGRPVSAADAADILAPGKSNTFNVYICFLRRKLEKGEVRIIRTVRGEGYCIDP